jgi:hypothetical protein
MRKIIKLIYKLIPNPIKIFIYTIIKEKFNLETSIYQHLHFRGFFKLKYKEKEMHMFSMPTIIENELFWNGIEDSNHEPMSYMIWYENGGAIMYQ